MSDAATARINTTVDQCLDRCLKGPKTPLATLADFIDELRENEGWSEPEIDVVRSVTARLLAQMGRIDHADMVD